jgi:hypothetical protein
MSLPGALRGRKYRIALAGSRIVVGRTTPLARFV